MAVERVEFPGQAAGKRRTDPPAVCIQTVRAATEGLAERLSVPTRRIAIGGRSFGGRMCSLAAAEGLDVAALVLVSYPLHPPGRPERLRIGKSTYRFHHGRKLRNGAGSQIVSERKSSRDDNGIAILQILRFVP